MQIGPRIRLDNHSAGNVLKNVSPLLAFTGAGALGAGAAGALGERLRGKTDLGSIAKAGLSNAAIGGGLHAGYGALKAGAARAGMTGYAPTSEAFSSGALGETVPRSTFIRNAASEAGGMIGDSLGSAAKGVGSFVKDNPLAVSTGLQAIGGIADNAEERRNNTFAMSRLTRQDEIEEEERKRRQRSGDEIRRLLGEFYPGSGY